MVRRSLKSVNDLKQLLGGAFSADFSITSKSEQDLKQRTNELHLYEGRFASLTAKQQDTARWRSLAVQYVMFCCLQPGAMGASETLIVTSLQLGCSDSSLKRWHKVVDGSPFGKAYWHLLLIDETLKKEEWKGHYSPSVWLRINELLHSKERPSSIREQISQQFGVDVSVKTICRIARSENDAGRLDWHKFTNRFQ